MLYRMCVLWIICRSCIFIYIGASPDDALVDCSSCGEGVVEKSVLIIIEHNEIRLFYRNVTCFSLNIFTQMVARELAWLFGTECARLSCGDLRHASRC